MKIKNKMGLTPAEIVKELDRYIIGQENAKKAVAVAMRNRYRRAMIEEPMRSEIVPKNILMIGSTGVGKTEIARRVAKLANAPFIKVEATKFTEVGYVGRDVESIIRDLTEIAINDHRTRAKDQVKEKAKLKAISKILDSVVGSTSSVETRDKFTCKILDGELDNTEIEIAVKDTGSAPNTFEIPGMPGGGAMGIMNISDMLGKALGSEKTKNKKLTVKEAIEILTSEESDKLIDEDKIIFNAVKSIENDGIVFLDEIDKITSTRDSRGGEVSREGVQRDLLPLIEGTNVVTKYGTVKTDHILFISSGAFHLSKPSDLLPELQGRLPIRVEMSSLSKEDLIKILTIPESSLIKQYTKLLATEGVTISFDKKSIEEIASNAAIFNQEIENIGARRLHTIMEYLLEEISFTAGNKAKEKVVINAKFVKERLDGFRHDTDLAKFIL